MMSFHHGIARRAGIVAVTAGVSLLTVACGSTPAAGNVGSTTSPQAQDALPKSTSLVSTVPPFRPGAVW